MLILEHQEVNDEEPIYVPYDPTLGAGAGPVSYTMPVAYRYSPSLNRFLDIFWGPGGEFSTPSGRFMAWFMAPVPMLAGAVVVGALVYGAVRLTRR